MKKPLVGVVMGSNSGWKVVQHAVDVLKGFGIAYEAKVVSAHRTPDTLYWPERLPMLYAGLTR